MRRRTELVVLAAVGVLVVVAGVAAVLLGGDDGGAGDDARASTPMTVPTASGDGTDPTGPIVGPSGIVGTWSGSAWVSRSDGEPPGGDVELTIVGLSGGVETAPGVTVDEECAAPGASAAPDLAVELPEDGPPPIAVAGVAEPRPRPVELLDTSSATYQQAAAEVGAGLGVPTPPTLTQVVRADLDGSGTDEVVVAAEHAADPAAPQPGDWSVVFLRRVVGNGVATDVVASSIAGADGGDGGFDRIRISSLADLNADGRMEIVLDGRSSGGQWTAIHELGDGGVPAEVLRDGCAG